MTKFKHALAVVAAVAITSCTSDSQPATAQVVELVQVATGLSQITDIQSAPGETAFIYVLEKTGRVQRVPLDGGSKTTFLDLSDVVITPVEMGLLGLAFHPDFESNGLFYVNYNTNQGGPARTVISEFSLMSGDPTTADRSSERVILEFEQPYQNHNGGQIAFGPDGFLYIGTGDGGAANDPLEAGQDLTTLLGKMLRIDVDSREGSLEYAIPASNPFVDGSAGERGEIYAYGLRNPWRFSFDSETGRLWAGDVGQNAWEEIDIIEAGGNYGWSIMEGFHCFDPPGGCDSTGLISPVIEYGHGLGVSVTGGYVYHGSNQVMDGKYIYGDFASGRIWALDYNESSGEVRSNEQIAREGIAISTFGLDPNGEILVGGFSDGRVYRIEVSSSSPDDAARFDPLDGVRYAHARGEVRLDFDYASPIAIRAELFDILGRSVSGELVIPSRSARYDIPTVGLSAGQYLLRLSTDRASRVLPLAIGI